MKIFFSYPHDHNQPFVERVKDALEARGHEVWFDQKEIEEGDEWRAKITKGILESDSAVAFLSAHSVRDPGVCLNEIAIAMAEKGDEALITVLVEPEREVSAPLSVTHIQWLNMEDWATHDNDAEWFPAQIEQLIHILEHPASINRNAELETLRMALDPLSFNAERNQHLVNFVGRKWLFDQYEAWLNEDDARRVFWVEGGPGLGKTAIASRLTHLPKSSIAALYMCRYNYSASRDPFRFVKTLAYQLASRLPDYRSRLLKVPAICDTAIMQTYESEHDLWNSLIAEPMSGRDRNIIDRHRMAIIVDGLDEATVHGKNAIVKLLAGQIKYLPKWLNIIITSQPDEEIKQRFSAYQPIVIKGDDPNNIADLQSYLSQWLDPIAQQGKLTAEQLNRAKTTIQKKWEGSFLYLIKVREAVNEGVFDLTKPLHFPQGLTEIYLSFFERRFADTDDNSAWVQQAKPLLGYISASPEPLPLDIAQQLMGWDIADDGEEQQAKTLRKLGSLLNQQQGDAHITTTKATQNKVPTLALFHNSAREWLQDSEHAGDYFISAKTSTLTQLTIAVWQRYQQYTQAHNIHESFGWQVLPVLMPQLKEKDELLLNSILGQPEVIEVNKLLIELAKTQGRLIESMQLFQIQVAYNQRLLGKFPGNLDILFDLGESFGSLGNLYGMYNYPEAHFICCMNSLDIKERLVRSDSNNHVYSRNLAYYYPLVARFFNIKQHEKSMQYLKKSYELFLDLKERGMLLDRDNAYIEFLRIKISYGGY